MALCQRTLSLTLDFDPEGLKDLPLVGGLHLALQTSTTRASVTAPHRRTLSCTADFDHEWPQELPLIEGLHLMQQTPTTEGLKKLPLVGGLCLA